MGSGIKVPAGFQRGRWCREHTGHFCKSFRSQRRTDRRLLDIRKRTGHGRYSRDKKSALYRADGTESDENVCC